MQWIGGAAGQMAPVPSLREGLGLQERTKGIVSFVGGGGKTTTMYTLARELAEAGFRVAVTTTTHIGVPEERPWLTAAPDLSPEEAAALAVPGRAVCIGNSEWHGTWRKLICPGERALDHLAEAVDFLLIEADGSKGLPMKAPAGHEPVLYERTDYVAAVYGLSALGKPLKEVCHRPERAAALLGRKPEDTVTGEDAAAILAHPEGQKKNVGERTYCVVLNQADDAERRKQAETIAAGLAVRGVERCLITFHQQEEL